MNANELAKSLSEQHQNIEEAHKLLDRIEANLKFIIESIKARKQAEKTNGRD